MTEALQKYSILTMGDGLVSQIPSLIISLSTGILVTKVSKESDLGNVLLRQLFSIPKVLYITGGALAFLAFTPMPTLICLCYAIVFIAAGRAIEATMEDVKVENEIDEEEESAEEIRKPENVVSLLQVDPIELEFGYGQSAQTELSAAFTNEFTCGRPEPSDGNSRVVSWPVARSSR